MKVKGFTDTIDWYDKNAIQYANASYPGIPYDLIDKFLSYLPKNPKILDAGCGPGRDCGIFNKLGAQITGLDISEGLLKVARARNPDVPFVKGDFLNLPFENESFDGIWAHAALVHLESIDQVKKAIQEFKRVLKLKGILHVYVKEQTGNQKTAVVNDKLTNHDRFFRYYSQNELKTYLENEGFIIKEQTQREDFYGRADVRWICIFATKT